MSVLLHFCSFVSLMQIFIRHSHFFSLLVQKRTFLSSAAATQLSAESKDNYQSNSSSLHTCRPPAARLHPQSLQRGTWRSDGSVCEHLFAILLNFYINMDSQTVIKRYYEHWFNVRVKLVSVFNVCGWVWTDQKDHP